MGLSSISSKLKNGRCRRSVVVGSRYIACCTVRERCVQTIRIDTVQLRFVTLLLEQGDQTLCTA